MQHVMLDLETMGVRPTSAIIAIGAVAFEMPRLAEGGFDATDGKNLIIPGKTGEEFYCVIDLESCVQAGLTLDASTILWWMQQSDEARKQFDRPGVDIYEALMQFSDWMKNVGGKYVWGNGAAFDNVLLTNAYQVCEKTQPWKCWDDRCYRTMKAQYPNVKMNRVGTHHQAVDDARSQAIHLMEIVACSL